MILFNGGWMSLYDGVGVDGIVNGGSYIDKHGFGGETYNFRNCNGTNYGYVMTRSHALDLLKINLGEELDEPAIRNAVCVFVATHPRGGRRIVGWYQNANIYAQYQTYRGDDRPIMISPEDWGEDSDQVGYYVSAQVQDVVLLTEDERTSAPKIPSGKGGFGQSNVWYADSDIGIQFRQQVEKFITKYTMENQKAKTDEQKRHVRGHSDLEAKKKVEIAAIERVREHYESLGYQCKSVEKENKGWDLEVSKGHILLQVEVKGLAQSHISVMLSQNEYQMMKSNPNSYRLAVVTNCLDQTRDLPCNIFSYIQEKNGWFDQHDNKIKITEIIAARCELE